MRTLSITLLLLCLMVGHVSAQGEDGPATETPAAPSATDEAVTPIPTIPPSRTPSPVPTATERPIVADFITGDWYERVIFPAGVYFQMGVEFPELRIADITLTLNVEGESEPRVIAYEEILPTMDRTDFYVTIRYFWAVPPLDPPPMGARVQYEWLVTLDTGEQARVPGEFVFRDLVRTWVIAESPETGVNLIYPQDEFNPSALRSTIARLTQRLREDTGQSVTLSLLIEPTDIVFNVCETRESFSLPNGDSTVPCDRRTMETMLRELGYTRFEGALADIAVTLVESYYAPYWENSDIPDWLRYGIIQLYTNSSGYQQELAQVQEAARLRSLYTLDEMDRPDDSSLWRAQATVMTLYAADLYGLDTVIDLAQTIGAEPFAVRYNLQTRGDVAGLIRGLENWSFRDRAAHAAALDIYGEATATLTASPTVTPFPPTDTPTPTHTPTLTLTPTVTGVLSATPLPTLTPTLTATPRPPTITPLPADFALPTEVSVAATDVPVVTPAPEGDDPMRLIGLALIGLALIGGVVIAVMIIRAPRD